MITDINRDDELFNLHNVQRISEAQMIIYQVSYTKVGDKEDPITSTLDKFMNQSEIPKV